MLLAAACLRRPMMKRRRRHLIIFAMVVTFTVACGAPGVAPQATPRTYRIGYFGAGGNPQPAPNAVALVDELSRLGYVEVGGLMTYGSNTLEMYRRTAVYVDKILCGAKPADLPVGQAEHFELVINLKAANDLGLTIPGSVLLRATEIIR
jgi:hypothetical protein